MIAPDANLLLYAYIEHSPFHKRAVKYLEGIFSGVEPVGVPLPSLHAYIRLITKPAVAGIRISLQSALTNVQSWLDMPHVRILSPGPDHWKILERLALQAHAASDLFPDAVLAAIAIEHGAIVHSHDRDFARFPGLRWHNPLE